MIPLPSSLIPYYGQIKAGLIIIAISGYTYGVQHIRWIIDDHEHQQQIIAARDVIDNVNEQATKDTNASIQDALTAQAKLDEAIKQNDVISAELHNALRMPKRGLCQDRVPKASDAGIPDKSQTEPELSEEFKRFLESEARRADIERETLEAAHDWALDACKKPNVICSQ